MAGNRRNVTGVLRRFGEQKFLATEHGHMWRLEVEDDRVLGLVGLTVQVEGKQRGNLIMVDGIKQA